jgi:hypothetical protein
MENEDTRPLAVRVVDPEVRLAIALRARPGGYALLLGAGISGPTGVPAAWEVLEDLIRKVAAASGADAGAEPATWWRKKASGPPDYPTVLAQVAETPDERRSVLASYFERTDEDIELERKTPSEAHHAIAHLVACGLVRVILTTNFDLLQEDALRQAGIEPVVLSTPEAIGNMEPLHVQRCVVIHLHGDYLNPGALNTEDELGVYPAEVARLVAQVFDEYGLVIVGWSAAWDKALSGLLENAATKRYSTWWIEPRSLSPRQVELSARRSAEFLTGTADAALTSVSRACDALADLSARSSPITVATAVAAAKRELCRPGNPLRTHDALRLALDHLGRSEVVKPASFDGDATERRRRVDTLLRGSAMALGLIAALAYWGDGATDRWWFDSIERFAYRPHVSGTADLISLSRAPGLLVMYSAGVAATAADRWPLVTRLLKEPRTETSTGGALLPVSLALTPGSVGLDGAASQLFALLYPIFVDNLGLDSGSFIDAWERFEYLHHLTFVDALNREEAELYGPTLGWQPHLRVEGLGPREGRPTADLWFEIAVLHGNHPLVPGWLPPGNLENARAAFIPAFAKHAKDSDWGLLPAGGGFLPSGRHYPGRYDDKARPDERLD